MGAKIPPTLKIEVTSEWLHGIPRDQIAKKNQIRAGTVSAIIKECKQENSELDLLREVAVNLKKENLNVGDFASTIRLKNKLIAWGLTEDAEIEDLIEKVNVYCFKSDLAPGKFIEMIYNVGHLANQSKTSVDKLPSKISKEQKKLEYLQQKVKQIRKITENELSKHQVTLNDLADY